MVNSYDVYGNNTLYANWNPDGSHLDTYYFSWRARDAIAYYNSGGQLVDLYDYQPDGWAYHLTWSDTGQLQSSSYLRPDGSVYSNNASYWFDPNFGNYSYYVQNGFSSNYSVIANSSTGYYGVGATFGVAEVLGGFMTLFGLSW